MTDQVYFEDVQPGSELPTLRKDPTTQQLVMYAGASGDFYQIHYDQEYARANGLPNVILHGALKNAFLGHLVTDWIGELGTLKKLDSAVPRHGRPRHARVLQGRRHQDLYGGRRRAGPLRHLAGERRGQRRPPPAALSSPSRSGRVSLPSPDSRPMVSQRSSLV